MVRDICILLLLIVRLNQCKTALVLGWMHYKCSLVRLTEFAITNSKQRRFKGLLRSGADEYPTAIIFYRLHKQSISIFIKSKF